MVLHSEEFFRKLILLLFSDGRELLAISKVAQEAIDQDRTVMIAGDFNTAFEAGKFGTELTDCVLKDFSCKRAPFPEAACVDGDGFDDTLSILEKGLVAESKWVFLSRHLGRTYKSTHFADLAIDHIAIDENSASDFTAASKAEALYGSDHFPIRPNGRVASKNRQITFAY